MLPDGTQRHGDEGSLQGLVAGSESLGALQVELSVQAIGNDALWPLLPWTESGLAPELDSTNCYGSQHKYELEI